jgi:hypothetical protein
MIPVKECPDFEPEESLESYLEKWPEQLDNIPECVIDQWCYRHNDIFIKSWSGYKPENWDFELVKLDCNQIFEIEHLDGELDHYDYVGDEFIKHPYKRDFVANYMLEHGTFPQPIIVAVDAGELEHPKSLPGECMKEPYQLIEGHRRLGLLRAMINSGVATAKSHKVWLMKFNT